MPYFKPSGKKQDNGGADIIPEVDELPETDLGQSKEVETGMSPNETSKVISPTIPEPKAEPESPPATTSPTVSSTEPPRKVVLGASDISHEEFQKARRISRAIQKYLESTGKNGLRSTDLYPMLARKKLIQTDRHNGLHFRRFLITLKEKGVLKSLIPQCDYRETKNEFNQWYFYAVNKSNQIQPKAGQAERIIAPNMPEDEAGAFIEKYKSQVKKLPMLPDTVTPQVEETRLSYPRAYAPWTYAEINIMNEVYQHTKRIDKVAELLQRQPSSISMKLKEF